MAYTYLWNFGDNSTSTEQNPIHVYTTPGRYTVSLTITDLNNNVYESLVKTYYITVYSIEGDPFKSTKSYNLGLSNLADADTQQVINFEQGIGFSEYDGYWPMPESKTGVLKIIDVNNYPRVLVLDYKDGKFYDISSRDAPKSSNIKKIFKDKILIDNTGGYDIEPEVTFKEDLGEYEKYILNHLSSRFYLRPEDEEDRSEIGYDTNGYISGIEFTTTIYKNGNPITYVAQAEDINKNNEIVYDRNIEDYRLQTKFGASKSGFKFVGRQQDYIVKDINYSPDDRITSEIEHQQNLGIPISWFSRGDLINTDRITGTEVSGISSYTTGPDSYSNSAFNISGNLDLSTITNSSSNFLMCFSDSSNNIAFSIGGNSVTLTEFNNDSGWYLLYASGINYSGIVNISGVSNIFDLRIYSADKTTDLNYYFKDVIENHGDNVCPLF